MSIAQNFGSTRPSLLLDFANTKTLDPRVTFTRASTATFYDGKTVAKAEENLLLYSQEFEASNWSKNNTAISANSTVAPDGSTTADTITANGATGLHSVSYLFTHVSGLIYTFSCFIKAGTNDFVQLAGNSATGSLTANFQLSTATAGTVSAGVTSAITAVGGGWYRVSATYTAASASVGELHIVISSSASAGNRESNSLATTLIIWGAQLEQRSSVTAYTPTTTQPITNYIPVLQTAAAGVARFDHNPTTGESLGLLIEEQRTNLLTYSEQFDNAAWTKTRSSIIANTVVAPDGTLTGDNLVENTDNNTHILQLSISLSSVAYTLSFYAKAGNRNWVSFINNSATNVFANFNLASGTLGAVGSNATATIAAVGNGWYRCAITFTAFAGSNVLLIRLGSADATPSYQGDGYSGIYIWGAQLEAGAFPTSYIKTEASQVTRSADAASMTGTNFSSWYRADEGTIYNESSLFGGVNGVSYTVTFICDGTTANRISSISYNNGTATFPGLSVAIASVNQASLYAVAGIAPNVSCKYVGSYATNSFALSKDGASVLSDASGNVPTGMNSMFIGARFGNADYLNGHIRKIAYYPKRLSNANLQALTS